MQPIPNAYETTYEAPTAHQTAIPVGVNTAFLRSPHGILKIIEVCLVVLLIVHFHDLFSFWKNLPRFRIAPLKSSVNVSGFIMTAFTKRMFHCMPKRMDRSIGECFLSFKAKEIRTSRNRGLHCWKRWKSARKQSHLYTIRRSRTKTETFTHGVLRGSSSPRTQSPIPAKAA